MNQPTFVSRRKLLLAGTGLAAVSALPRIGPAFAAAAPTQPYGVQSGDVTADSAILWGRSSDAGRMMVEVATHADFSDARRMVGPAALEDTDYTAKLEVSGLPSGETIHYRVAFQSLDDINVMSAPVTGRFRTAPGNDQDVRFLWSGDTAGQGWGINLEWGGMKIFDAMLKTDPHFFIHCGDSIYADGPIKAEVELPDGSIWKNVTLKGKDKVAETLAEFRACYKYNLMDENVRKFNAGVAQYVQWDDHETLNNWYPQEVLTQDDRYQVKSVALLSARAKRAFMEYMPIRPAPGTERIYRSFSHGPALDLFMIDMRTYRGPNTANRQEQAGPETVFMGSEQIRWLKEQLLASNATWKVIASDMPIGLLVRDGDNFENMANGDGPPLGRELEMADLLRFIRDQGIKNVVWFTADVHYTAAHYYDPEKAQFKDFAPFWEFVSGPLNAGTFGPNELDNTFGPQVVFQKAPAEGQKNLPPSAGMQFFGQVDIDGSNQVMTVSLKDLAGESLYKVDLKPEA